MNKSTDRILSNRQADEKRRFEKPWRSWYKDKRWYRVRQMRLRDEPLCRMCTASGRITGAWIVDHIKPHKGDAALFFCYENTQSLCETHHNRDKQREERGSTQAVGADGWPLEG
jgi:5-methylcytosine-specific restriction protein A